MLNERHYLDDSTDDVLLPEGATSLTEVLQRRAVSHPRRIAYIFLDYGVSGQHSLTYEELNTKVKQLATSLQQMGMPGERALLLYPPGLDYIVAFFACLYAGVIAVPAYPPSNSRHMPRLRAILDDSKAKIILTTRQVAGNIRDFPGATGDLLDKHWLRTDADEHFDDASSWQPPLLQALDLAFLQYTSGSTGDVKGVMISHGNLMANQQLIKRRFGHDERSTVVGWLPLYHDMGLIGNVMQPLYCGASAILMAPMAFLEKPLRWLQAISDYRAHTSGGPNFAYDLCVQKISRDELAGIDLSSWQLAFNGAEPINPLTLQRFGEAFSACGFRQRSFYPCYGLAEATLLATGGAKQSLPRIAAFDKTALEQRRVQPGGDNPLNARSLVGCGAIDIDGGQDLRIVEPDSAACCAEGRIGEIWLSGPSIAQGYWQNPEMSGKAFVKDAEGRSWLRSGDLGFIDGGELFVSGRLKDLIIIRGRNYYPHDLEHAVEVASDALNPASTVAFSVDEGDGEKLVVLAELKRNRVRQGDYRSEFSAIRARLAEECGIQADQILFLKPGAILKTSSGKLRRSACREVYLQQGFEAVASDAEQQRPPGQQAANQINKAAGAHNLLRHALLAMDKPHAADLLAQHLAGKVAELSGVAADDSIDRNHSLTGLGLDSLKAVELKYFIDELLGIDLPISYLLGAATLHDGAVTALGLIGKANAKPPIAVNGANAETAMSYNQQALWTQAKMQSCEALYHMPVALKIHGDLDGEALRQALVELCRRHPQLRSGFGLNAENRPVCLPLDNATPQLARIVCSGDEHRQENLQAFVRQPFDLEHGPLLRVSVFRCGAEDHLLAFCAHHLIVDFRSLVVLLSELQTLYLGCLNGVVSHLPMLAASYSEYVRRQQSYLDSEAANRDLQFWLRQLKGELPRLELPGVRSDGGAQSMAADMEGLTIAADVLARLKHLAAEHNTTLYTLLLTVFKTLLHRYSGQQDLIVGSPTLGRPMRQFAELVGYFVNPVALRSRPSGNLRFCDYLTKVDAAVRGALEHQCYPHALLIDKLRAEQAKGAIELYRTFFVLQDNADPIAGALAIGRPDIKLRWAGLEARTCRLPETAEEFDLAMLAAETDGGLSVTFRYRTDVLMRETMLHLLGHFQCLLHGILANADKPLAQLPFLTVPEQTQLAKWNATEAGFPQDFCLHCLFETQVEQTPNAIALTFEDRHLSYAELNAKANQLAHYLISQGVGPEVLVGLCIERSPEMVVGLLGILKAGGAYVPLDPHYPEERLRYMLDDSGVELLLTRQEMLAGNNRGVGYTSRTLDESGVGAEQLRGAYPTDGVGRGRVALITLCLDSGWPSIAASPVHNPEPRSHPLDLAYIIYTSGSTGQPKGVAVTHRNAVHSTAARFAHYPDPVQAYLLLSSFAFDSSVAGIFWTLGQGGCLCLPAGDAGKDPAELAALIERHRVSHLLALPSLYALLLEQVPERLNSLKATIVAGEACANDVVRRHFDVLPQTKLYNEYGPTEATVWSSVYQASLADLDKPLSIGRPIANARLYILDNHLNPVPAGVAGELYIGGAGIVRGYLNRPELSAERFIPDPFQAGGGRLYKTGDLARYRADGAIEFLGRIDHQVKIRGFRIELGEIEAQLLNQPNVKEAVVLAREDQPGDKKLVAYLVEDQLGTLVIDELKAQLKQALPDYMVPSAFVILDAMPLSANGKLDRKKLPAPDWSGLSNAEYAAPQTPVEAALIQIWQQLLAVERIGRHDNFFELGGDSILSIQVVSRARQAGIVVTPKQLFQQQTIAELAAVAETASRAVAEQGLVTGELPLTPIQHWFFERNLSKPQHWNQALMLRIKPDLTPAVFKAALHKLLIQHDALRMRFTEQPGQWLQTNLAEETHNILEYCDLSAVAAEQRSERLQAKAGACQAALDLSQGPLLRAVWFDIGDGGSQILIAIHHLVVDGVSWRILLEDLNLACRQKLAGECIQLPAKTTAFQYWAERLQALALSGELALDTGYWRDPRRKQAQTLPVDEPAGANRVELEETVVVALNAEQTRALLQEVPAAYRTQIDEVLLTALAQTLRSWTSANDNGGIGAVSTTTLLIDREGHGREHLADDLDVSRTVGWFTNVYPLLLTIDSGDDLAQSLKSIKEQSRAVPDHGISYGLLRYLSDDAELRQTLAGMPPARIIFNYLGQLDTVLSGDTLFEASSEAAEISYDPAGERAHELDVVSSIRDGCLQLSWRYSRERYRRATLETLAGNYLQQLQTLIAHCTQAETGGYTPSDFPLAALTQSQLDGLNLLPRQIDDLYPLAPLQHGLMFHSLYEPDANVYRIQLACRLTGKFDAVAFQQAWQQLLERHAILRTRFQVQGLEQPLQIVDKQAKLPISEHDWRHLTEAERQQQWQAMKAADHAQGFDFSRAPLMRLALATCSNEQHYLLWSYHHVLLDGWSMPLLIKEVFAIYHALQRGERPGLPVVKPYRDYIAWLQCQDGGAAESYWRQNLAGFEAAIVLGADLGPGGHRLAGKVQKQSLLFSEAETQCLQRFVKQRQLTLNTLAQAAWGLLLSHYSGSEDVVFGITVSGRPAELIGIEEHVGLFINTLPMRVRIKPENQIDDWLRNLFEQNQEMRRYEYARLSEIQNGSDIGRGQNLFDSLLVFENYPIDQALMEIGDPLKIDEVVGNDPTNYPLTLTVFPGQQLLLEINHDVSRFTQNSVERMLTHLQQLLNGFAQQPQAKLGSLPTLTDVERRQILEAWNTTEVDYPQGRYIHQLFEAQAEQTPDAIALTFEERHLSYGELNAKANQLAHYLIAHGVGPDVLVGICIERSLEMVVGLLGILKAGGAYLPLDPFYPEDRLAFMLSDIAPPVVLTQAKWADRDFSGAQVLSLDGDWAAIEVYTVANPQSGIRPENLAYCIYTSGSTGQPKGAGVPHRGILNRLQWMQAEYRLDGSDSVLQKTPYSFDVSVWEFFWPLMSGARLVVAKPELHKDSQGLIELIRREGITTIHFVPSMLQAFVDTPDVEQCTSLKRVICSGEALPADLVHRFQQKLSAELHNLYGPTEASVDVSYWACPADCHEYTIPIGRPIANIRLYILDRNLNPVPVGTPGELHIAGIGLGRGYLNGPGLTAEKFIPDPFGPVGSRLYKTGDLVRYRPDSNIDYLGRNDFQIKIRGFRIELGEIENRLSAYAGVREAVVIAREDGHGDKRLVAYLTEDRGNELSIAGLRDYLAETLPDYMLPGAFVILPALPLSANGKVDRAALPKPGVDAVVAHRYEAPQGQIETALACIWRELLELERIGRNDHFFELGGHSLMALTLVERLRQQGWSLEPRAVFAYPILSDLGAAIADSQNNSPAFEMPPNLIPEHFGHSLNTPNFEEFRL